MKELLEEQLAFKAYVKQNYVEHPIGAILLAIELYEGCRTTSSSFFWDIMKLQGKSWDSDSFHNAAKEVIKVCKA